MSCSAKSTLQAWSVPRWSKQYATTKRNVVEDLKREREYASAMGGASKTLKLPYTLHQAGISIDDNDRCGQLKTGKAGLRDGCSAMDCSASLVVRVAASFRWLSWRLQNNTAQQQ